MAAKRNAANLSSAEMRTRRHGHPYGAVSDESLLDVPRLDARTAPNFYRDFVLQRRPAVLSHATEWSAHSNWSLDMFVERFGKRRVTVAGKTWTVKDFAQRVQDSTLKSPAPYLNGLPIRRVFPELLLDLMPSPAVAQPNWLTSRHMPARWETRDGFLELLIGGCGTRFPGLHYDQWFLNAFITQIVGDKHFILYHPNDTQNLYPKDSSPNRSQIDNIHDVDPSKFPKFANAEPVHVMLKEGETIFVPWGWWHITELPATSIAVSINTANNGNWKAFSQDFSKRSKPYKHAMVQWALRGVAALERRHSN